MLLELARFLNHGERDFLSSHKDCGINTNYRITVKNTPLVDSGFVAKSQISDKAK